MRSAVRRSRRCLSVVTTPLLGFASNSRRLASTAARVFLSLFAKELTLRSMLIVHSPLLRFVPACSGGSLSRTPVSDARSWPRLRSWASRRPCGAFAARGGPIAVGAVRACRTGRRPGRPRCWLCSRPPPLLVPPPPVPPPLLLLPLVMPLLVPPLLVPPLLVPPAPVLPCCRCSCCCRHRGGGLAEEAAACMESQDAAPSSGFVFPVRCPGRCAARCWRWSWSRPSWFRRRS